MLIDESSIGEWGAEARMSPESFRSQRGNRAASPATVRKAPRALRSARRARRAVLTAWARFASDAATFRRRMQLPEDLPGEIGRGQDAGHDELPVCRFEVRLLSLARALNSANALEFI